LDDNVPRETIQAMHEEIKRCLICSNTNFDFYLSVKDHFLTGEEFHLVRCAGCGFIFINPRPDFSTIAQYYKSEDYISHDASKNDLVSRVYKIARDFSIRGKFNLVNKYAASGTILDYGCGTGEFLAYCSTKGFHTTGLEPSPKARKFATERHKIAVFEKTDQLANQSGKFNVITLWHVLEHIHDLNETIETLNQLLAPSGTLIVAVPNCTSHDAKQYGSYWAAYDVPRHIYHFTKDTIRELFKKHNFYIHQILPQKLDAYYVSLLSEKYKNGKNNYLRTLATGFESNLKAKNPNRGYSSQIYILKRENT
jgi:2-polyprenyl-3-methyl-5-hydroxy-6-metoxy-1,4-benzoquinol methylase